MDVAADLPKLLPLAISWAEEQGDLALNQGMPLSPWGRELAKTVGVALPERVRIVLGETLPYPTHPLLREAAEQLGMFGPDMTGLTLGYAVFMIEGKSSPRLLSHELRHVYQYEQAGSIAEFLPVYLRQIIEVGYATPL